jgi:hypothetical protein
MDKPRTKARIMGIWCEADQAENGINALVPMARNAAQAIECLLEKPVFIIGCIRIPRRRTNDCYLIRRKNPLAKDVFTVTLFKATRKWRLQNQRTGAK